MANGKTGDIVRPSLTSIDDWWDKPPNNHYPKAVPFPSPMGPNWPTPPYMPPPDPDKERARVEEFMQKIADAGVAKANIRMFPTGATRDIDEGKLDYEGFLSPLALRAYAEFMHEHRKQSDGQLRDSDNWQKGMPKGVYMKSLLRHLMSAWLLHRGISAGEEKFGGVMRPVTLKDALCGILFNAFGYLHTLLTEETTDGKG